MRHVVLVPATSANLGPGFDCLGLALDLCNRVVVDTDAPAGVTWEGEGAESLPTDGTDRISRSMVAVAAAAGRSLPPLWLHGENRIPLERGLGSSAAAAVAGVLLADALLGLRLSSDDVVSSVVGIEGHPDNAAAAVLGGLTIATGDAVLRLEPHPELRPLVLVPEEIRQLTSEARAAMPERVPLEDAVFNLQRTAFAVIALTERPDLLGFAMDDRLHQPYRLPLLPSVQTEFERLRAAGHPVCVSGAGPSLLVFEADGSPAIDPSPGWLAIRPGIRSVGAALSPEP